MAVPPLAVLSTKKPTFKNELAVGKPNTLDIEKALEYFRSSLESGNLTNNGPFVQKLEKDLSELLGVKYCICVANATLGLQLVLRAELGDPWERGEKIEVIVPAWTFVATAHAVEMAGYRCVFCDCDRDSHLISVDSLSRCIGPNTAAVIGVHLWGRGCDVVAMEKLCSSHEIPLLFDAAHAFNCQHEGKKIGGFGRAEVFSFHATKFFSSAEGGMITTNNERLAEKCRFLRNFGFLMTDRVVCLGSNAKLSELHAGLALANLNSLNDLMKRCSMVWHLYKQHLSSIPGVQLVGATGVHPNSTNNYQSVVCCLDNSDKFQLNRDEIVAVLRAENVRCRRYFVPGVQNMEPYKGRLHPHPLPNTEKLSEICFQLPGGPSIKEEEIFQIVSILKTAFLHSKELKAHFKENPPFEPLDVSFSFEEKENSS